MCDHYISDNHSYRTTTPQHPRAHYSVQFNRPVFLGSGNSEEGPRNFEYDAVSGRCLAYSDVFDPLQEDPQAVPSTVHLTAYGDELTRLSRNHQGPSGGSVQTGWAPSYHQNPELLGQCGVSLAQMTAPPPETVQLSSSEHTNPQGQVHHGEWTLHSPQPSSVRAEQIPGGFLEPGSSMFGISLMLLSHRIHLDKSLTLGDIIDQQRYPGQIDVNRYVAPGFGPNEGDCQQHMTIEQSVAGTADQKTDYARLVAKYRPMFARGTQKAITAREGQDDKEVWKFIILALKNAGGEAFQVDGRSRKSKKCETCQKYYVKTTSHFDTGCPACGTNT